MGMGGTLLLCECFLFSVLLMVLQRPINMGLCFQGGGDVMPGNLPPTNRWSCDWEVFNLRAADGLSYKRRPTCRLSLSLSPLTQADRLIPLAGTPEVEAEGSLAWLAPH